MIEKMKVLLDFFQKIAGVDSVHGLKKKVLNSYVFLILRCKLRRFDSQP